MTQEEKQLLLKDLCSRLPYGVICYNSSTETNFTLNEATDTDSDLPTFDYGYGELEVVEPYLRPMSSMTEEEDKEYTNIDNGSYRCPKDLAHFPASKRIDWLNAHHFDYRGLIPMGLAIEVTEENNPYES